MEIVINEIGKSGLKIYSKIPMLVDVSSIYELVHIDNGLGGIKFNEIQVERYAKDLGEYDKPLEWQNDFDISNWKFFVAYDQEKAVGAAAVAYRTEGLNMLSGRDDLAVLWDIRVEPEYKSLGIGTKLFEKVVEWAKMQNCKQLKIETQNSNVNACKFYRGKNCRLGQIDEYAYYGEDDDETMLIWYLDL